MSTDINSIVGRLAQQVNKLLAKIHDINLHQALQSTDIVGQIDQQVSDAGKQLGSMISTPMSPEDAKERLTELDVLVTKLFLSLYGSQGAVESIPTVNKTGFANFTLSYVEARGVLAIIRSTIEPFIRHNLTPALDYALNQQYKNILPTQPELERLRDLGKLDPEGFITQGERATGIRGDYLDLIRKSKHQVPGLEDILTYNIRHPDSTIDLTAIQDVIGVNWTDYSTIFQERQWSDVSMRFVQNAANLLNFDEAQVTELLRLTRLNPNVNNILGMSPLQVAVSVIMKRKTLYNEGISAATKTTKRFTYSLLIKLAEAGEDVTPFMDSDLTLEGWDDAHRQVLESYIRKTVTAAGAKAAAKAAKTSGG